MDLAFGSKNPTEYEGIQLTSLAVGVSIVEFGYPTQRFALPSKHKKKNENGDVYDWNEWLAWAI